ncbi:DUF5320 domain-containing protein [Thermincola potens]|uniref:Cytoplasmic protein n=1 Tax=Thermincola potens (strain JR) TaxID=635013 RepID=D5XEN7_THEPJ|nr:DUF5320 domain-containing protein [Thermincola potens]ADG82108.1 conserved hypothetical protein [Thermincola potens JR]
MPGFDGTGPLGQGPVTGGGFGYCSSSVGQGNHSASYGTLCGVGRGGTPYGGGRGRCFGGSRRFGGKRLPSVWRNHVPAPVNEKEFLQGRIKALQAEIETINKKISELNQAEENK